MYWQKAQLKEEFVLHLTYIRRRGERARLEVRKCISCKKRFRFSIY